MDIPPVPDRLLAAAVEALHEECCGGIEYSHDPRLAEVDALGHRRDALTVFAATRGGLHVGSLRWAAKRLRAECTTRADGACAHCRRYAEYLDGCADAATYQYLAEHPDPGAHEEVRS